MTRASASPSRLYVLDGVKCCSLLAYAMDGQLASRSSWTPGTRGGTVDSTGRIYAISDWVSPGYWGNNARVQPVLTFSSGGVQQNVAFRGVADANDVAVGPSGKVFVSSAHDGEVLSFDGKTGTRTSPTIRGLHHAGGIAVDAQGNIYAVDHQYMRVVAYRPDGTEKFSITDGISRPRSVAIDWNGNLRVANYGSSTITTYRAKDGVRCEPTLSVDKPTYVSIGSNHTLIVTRLRRNDGPSPRVKVADNGPDGNQVLRMDDAGNSTVLFSGPEWPSVHNAVETTSGDVLLFAPTGVLRLVGGSGDPTTLISGASREAVAVDGAGNYDVLVDDASHNRIERFNPSGEKIGEIDFPMPSPLYPRGGFLAADSTGNIWVTVTAYPGAATFKSVLEYSPAGVLLNVFATGDEEGVLATHGSSAYMATEQGVEKFDASGNSSLVVANTQFGLASIAVDSTGRIYVKPYAATTIDIYSASGTLLSTRSMPLAATLIGDMTFDSHDNLWFEASGLAIPGFSEITYVTPAWTQGPAYASGTSATRFAIHN